jgi:hypothetical protein
MVSAPRRGHRTQETNQAEVVHLPLKMG